MNLYKLSTGQKIILICELKSGEDRLTKGTVLTVRTSNNLGVSAYGADRILHSIRHDDYKIFESAYIVLQYKDFYKRYEKLVSAGTFDRRDDVDEWLRQNPALSKNDRCVGIEYADGQITRLRRV